MHLVLSQSVNESSPKLKRSRGACDSCAIGQLDVHIQLVTPNERGRTIAFLQVRLASADGGKHVDTCKRLNHRRGHRANPIHHQSLDRKRSLNLHTVYRGRQGFHRPFRRLQSTRSQQYPEVRVCTVCVCVCGGGGLAAACLSGRSGLFCVPVRVYASVNVIREGGGGGRGYHASKRANSPLATETISPRVAVQQHVHGKSAYLAQPGRQRLQH